MLYRYIRYKRFVPRFQKGTKAQLLPPNTSISKLEAMIAIKL